jgi:hypothetical protein
MCGRQPMLELRQRAQVVVATRLQKSPSLHCTHLAVPSVQQSSLFQALPLPRERGHIQGIIDTLPRHHVGRHRKSEGVPSRQQDVHLRPLLAMVRAVPEREQPVATHRPGVVGRGAVQPDALGLQVIHTQQLPAQGALKGAPMGLFAPTLHPPHRPSLASIDSLPHVPAPGVQALFRPGFDVVQPMIGLRADMGQPEYGPPVRAKPHPMAVGREVLVQQGLHAHTRSLGQQQWVFSDAFTVLVKGSLMPRP